jgi:hypothetical protein
VKPADAGLSSIIGGRGFPPDRFFGPRYFLGASLHGADGLLSS